MKKIILGLYIVATAFVADARVISVWSRQQLSDKADLVVIAKPLATKDTPEATNPLSYGYPLAGLSTEFEISLVVKGDKDMKKLVLHHYRLKEQDIPTVNGPSLVSFDPKQGSSFLLYLRREADGRFAPVSGQYDPGEDAVVKLAPSI